MSDRIAIVPEPIAVEDAIAFVSDGAAGGVCVFLGTTRSEQGASGRALLSLDYEAYPEMAQQQLQELARGARQRWPVIRLALVHRVGRVPVGEASVLVAVSTPHRAGAFECCRWLIDGLKAGLAVWKKEVWESGEATWARPNQEWKRGGGNNQSPTSE